jgi:hypothetical protein
MSKSRNRWTFYDKIEKAPRFGRRAFLRTDRKQYNLERYVWQV